MGSCIRYAGNPSSRIVLLTDDDLCSRDWEFGPGADDAILGVMRFVPGGRIFGYAHPNEHRWERHGAAICLLNADGDRTSIFSVFMTVDGRVESYSRLVLDGQVRFFRLRERNRLTAYPQHLEALHAKERLRDLRLPLLVLFNSGGNPYSGKSVVWEYLTVTADPAVDYLRFAERSEPSSWYLKTDEKVKARLRAAALGRRKVVLAGASSGGYAAIRFGEWLAAQGIVETVSTISVNPQTVHSLRHRQALWINRWDELMPPTIADETLAFLPVKRVDLDAIIGRDLTVPLRHHVFFDSGNPAETYYARCIRDCPGVEINPIDIGLPHGPSVQEMERLGVMHRSIAEQLDLLPAS